jgi:hypothetical protein
MPESRGFCVTIHGELWANGTYSFGVAVGVSVLGGDEL